MIRYAIAIWLGLCPLAASAATCTWNASSGNWSVVANWVGCTDAAGPSTRTPGPGDIAVVASGQADLDVDATLAEFEIATSGIVSSIGSGALRTLTVAAALRLNGGKITTQLGQNQLLLALPAGATGSLLAPTTFENATFLENSGTLALGSTNGTALSLLVASQVRNMSGGLMTFSGGDSRLIMSSSSELTNNAGATLAINGNMLVSRPPAAFTVVRLFNFGSMTVSGPGTLNLALGDNSAFFQQSGQLTVSNATLACNQLAGELCHFTHNASGAADGIVTRLNNAVLDLGGNTSDLNVPAGVTLTGTGSINARGIVNGTLAPGALSGTPYGDLVFSGTLSMGGPSILAVDLAGSAIGSYDRVQVGGKMTVGGVFSPAGYGVLKLRLAAGYQPSLGASVPIVSYTSFEGGSAFHRVDANYTLDYAARFDPTALQVFPAPRITIEDVSVIEGSSGDTPAVFNVRLSQASAQTITAAGALALPGTANSGASPAGDFTYPGTLSVTFMPGQTLQTLVVQVHGDSVVEADEAFTVELTRNTIVNAAVGDHIPGSLIASATIISDDLPVDTRFVLVGKDPAAGGNRIHRYTTTGTFIDAWGPFTPNTMNFIATGMCFSPQGTLLSTRFAGPHPILYNRAGAVLDQEFGNVPGLAGLQMHESCAFDRAGNVFIGQADGSKAVVKFDRYGTALDSFPVPTGPRGSDWIELAGDQCTLYYTSEDTTVRRYNVCTHTVLPDFAIALTPPFCYALQLRPNRELMVACKESVHRLSPQGDNLQTYTRQSIGETDPDGLYELNLDPDNTSFWTGGVNSGNVYRVDIESGTVLTSFNTGTGGVDGLAVYGQPGDDSIFIDGFDPPLPLAPLVPTGPSTALYRESECEREFWPEMADMPHYVPAWVSLVVVDDGECED